MVLVNRTGNVNEENTKKKSKRIIKGIFSVGKDVRVWAGEMAQRLRALTALPEVLSSNPETTRWLTTICNEI